MKPTEEQIKELWEWCGLDTKHDMVEYGLHNASLDWCRKCHFNGDEIGIECDLPIDLNNLFKYAVPKLWEIGFWMQWFGDGITGWDIRIHHLNSNDNHSIYQDKDPALALFWAIQKVIK